jgi:hypothetical protein
VQSGRDPGLGGAGRDEQRPSVARHKRIYPSCSELAA